jgi:crotonobetainyl-CoA:carnitine CoA-transferase CaiB-like acyl-CoA transferase
MSATPWEVKRRAPLLGEHNEEVYCRALGYKREELVRMKQAGVI